MWSRLIIDGNAVYEIDDECVQKKQGKTLEKGSDQEPFSRHDQVRNAEK